MTAILSQINIKSNPVVIEHYSRDNWTSNLSVMKLYSRLIIFKFPIRL